MSERNRIFPDEVEFHPAANLFLPMSEEEFVELVEDIDTNGVREPIWVKEELARAAEHRQIEDTEIKAEGEGSNAAQESAPDLPNGRPGAKVVRQLLRAIRCLAGMPPVDQVIPVVQSTGKHDPGQLDAAIAWLQEFAEAAARLRHPDRETDAATRDEDTVNTVADNGERPDDAAVGVDGDAENTGRPRRSLSGLQL